jgi:hypothetical protein
MHKVVQFPKCLSKIQEIDIGTKICRLIKQIYFSDKKCMDCYGDVSISFSNLKSIIKKRHPDMTHEDILRTLTEYDEFDLREALDG